MLGSSTYIGPYFIVVGADLFTAQADTVNFKSLNSDQVKSVNNGAGLYDALDGNDEVTLPNSTSIPGTTKSWDSGQWFIAGEGNDTISGGKLNDKIDGGFGNDILAGSPGNDQLMGGEGTDTFDYQTGNFKNFRAFIAGQIQTIDGGTEDAWTEDIIKLPGSASDYSFVVTFASAWGDTLTTITNPYSTLPHVTLITQGVEKAVFADPIKNPVTLSGPQSTGSTNLAIELAVLTKEVYGPLETLSHKAEILASRQLFDVTTDAVTAAAITRGWHPVSALELGMLPGDYDNTDQPAAYDTLDWSFVLGHYAAYNPNSAATAVVDDKPEANAMVLSGLVDGMKTLAVVFRGTDQEKADGFTFGNFQSYYDLYRPLIDGLRDYITSNAGKIDQILVAGHSLGAGALQYFLNEDFVKNSNTRAWTFGSPGSEDAATSNLFNLVHTDDLGRVDKRDSRISC